MRLPYALILALFPWPTLAQGVDMTRKDRMAILYSNQVVFDRKGEPLVSVRITESQTKIELQSRGRLTVLPGADDGARIRAPEGARWTVQLEQGQPAEVLYWVAADRRPAGDLEGITERRDFFTDQGHTVRLFEAGALLGIAGQTLDTRTVTIALDPQKTEAEAQALAETIATRHAILGEVIAEPVKRPTGWLKAREQRTGFELRAKDLLWFSPEGDGEIEVPDLEWGHGTPKRGRADRSYQGDVYLTIGRDGKLAAVNLLSAEALLEGVVPSELFPNAPDEALKAQAIAARGQLLAKVGTRHRSDPYLLCAETHCQVYTGRTRANSRATAAVRATRGQLLFDAQGGLIDTVYSSSCGGHGEAFDVYWGGPAKPGLEGRFDREDGPTTPLTEADLPRYLAHPPKSYCAESAGHAGVFRWERTLSGAEVTRALNARQPIGEVHTIRATRRGVSGCALAVEYVGTTGKLVVEGSYENRKLLYGLKSGVWLVERQGGAPGRAPASWTFKGAGFGHGVGLCQHGAVGMAKAGFDYAAILSHYYPGSSLARAW